MKPDTQWIDVPVPGGVERISRHAWDAARDDAREKIAQELEAEYRRLVADWNQGIGTFDRACAAQFSADFVRRGGKG